MAVAVATFKQLPKFATILLKLIEEARGLTLFHTTYPRDLVLLAPSLI
jgi:hypothetical protein